MSNLALLGGNPVSSKDLSSLVSWPPVKDSTGEKLLALYHSKNWGFGNNVEEEFAQAFANYQGAKHGILMANGTVTLESAMRALGIGPGDEVIVPAFTWLSTAMAVSYLGATPVIVDVEKDTLCIDPEKVRAALSPKTKAIIPVHIYSSMADMDAILAIAKEYDLKVIEDCAQMPGGMWDGKGVGSMGDVGSFSFQQAKHLASGEGGICITNDDALAERLFRLKHIGYGPGVAQGLADSGPEEGLTCRNYRITAFQALVLNEQLNDFPKLLEQHRDSIDYIASRLLSSTNIRAQQHGRKATAKSYYVWPLIFDHADFDGISMKTLLEALKAEGLPLVKTAAPVHQHVLFNLNKNLYRMDSGGCPIAEVAHDRSLALYHQWLILERPVIEKICDIIIKVANNCDHLRAYQDSDMEMA